MSAKIKYDRVFVSDTHLGSKYCRAKELRQFLSSIECQELHLVGDVIDGWVVKRKGFRYWNDDHTGVLHQILKLAAKKDTKVFWYAGNHDEFLFRFLGSFGHVNLLEQQVVLINDKKYLVLHGQQFDGLIKYSKLIYSLGSHLYNFMMWLNRRFNWFRRRVGLPYWSLSQKLKRSVKQAIKVVNNFEYAVEQYCKDHAVDGVICGHIHHAKQSTLGSIQYINCGDWIEGADALVEKDNKLELIKFR